MAPPLDNTASKIRIATKVLIFIAVLVLSATNLHASKYDEFEARVKQAFLDSNDQFVMAQTDLTSYVLSPFLRNLPIFVLSDENSDYYDFESAVYLLRSEAERGNPIAQRDLAEILLFRHLGGEDLYDPVEGLRILKKARDQGYVPAETLYVNCCLVNGCLNIEDAIETLSGFSGDPDFWWAAWMVVKLKAITLSDVSSSYAYEEALRGLIGQAEEIAKDADEDTFGLLAYLWWLEFKRSPTAEERTIAANQFLKWLHLGRSAFESLLQIKAYRVEILKGATLEKMIEEAAAVQTEDASVSAAFFLKIQVNKDLEYVQWCRDNVAADDQELYLDCLAKSGDDHFKICFGNFYDRFFGSQTQYLKSRRYNDCRVKAMSDRVWQSRTELLKTIAFAALCGLIGLILMRFLWLRFLKTFTSVR